MVAQAKHAYPAEEMDRIQRFLLEKASKRNRKLTMVQKDLAAELGMEKTRFHRIVAQLAAEDRIRVIADHRTSTTVIVAELD